MNRNKMIKRLEVGDKPIDVSIDKWIGILNGTGCDKRSTNCSLCYFYGDFLSCNKCPLEVYGLIPEEGKDNEFGALGGCGGFYSCTDMTYKDKQCMLSLLYAVKEEMIKDGVY